MANMTITGSGTPTVDIKPTEAGQTINEGKFGTETVGCGGDDFQYQTSADGSNRFYAPTNNLFQEVQQFVGIVANAAVLTNRAAIFRIQQVLRAMLEQAPS